MTDLKGPRHGQKLRRLVDPPGQRPSSDPPGYAPKIQYMNHDSTFEQIAPFFPGLKKEDLPDGEGWAIELVQLTTHNGTHLDAPYHFHSTMNKHLGRRNVRSASTRCRWTGASSRA